MRKDVTLTFRMPALVREAVEEAARRDLRTAGQFVLKTLIRELVATGLLTETTGAYAIARARPGEEALSNDRRGGWAAAGRFGSSAAAERVARYGVPRDEKPDAPRGRRKTRPARG